MGMGGPGMGMQAGYGAQAYGQHPQQQVQPQQGADSSAQQPAASNTAAPSGEDANKAASGEDADLDVAPVSMTTTHSRYFCVTCVAHCLRACS